jgi:hypothetical protein
MTEISQPSAFAAFNVVAKEVEELSKANATYERSFPDVNRRPASVVHELRRRAEQIALLQPVVDLLREKAGQ